MSDGDHVLEQAAQILESRAGNEIYRKAWRRAAKILRAMKLTSGSAKLTDNPQRIDETARGL